MRIALKTLTACMIAALAATAGCGSGDDFDCPSCHDEARGDGYGRFTFYASGNDDTARAIVKNCGFSVYDGHDGGYGDTFEIAGCFSHGVPGVTLVWAYEQFSAYRICDPGYEGVYPPLEPGQCLIRRP